MINKIEKFNTFSKNVVNEEFVGGGKTFYKIIDKNKLPMWLKKILSKIKKLW